MGAWNDAWRVHRQIGTRIIHRQITTEERESESEKIKIKAASDDSH